MYWKNRVIWSEGMFLQPQHFQQHDRYLERLLEGRAGPLTNHSRGFVSLEVDSASLALGKIQISSACGILPDGTPFDFPALDAPPDPLDIEAGTKDEVVFLVLPVRRAGTDEAESGEADARSLTRFSALETEVTDSNTSSDRATPIQVGSLRLKLLRKRDVTDAYCKLGVVKIMERRADNQVVLDESYIPPMLHTGGARNTTLAKYVHELHGLLRQRGKALASKLTQPGHGVSEVANFLMLQTVNRYELLFAHLAKDTLLHPERLYSTCLLLAGDLATFSHSDRRPPILPEYQHDALDTCFPPLITEIRQSLSLLIEESAVSIDLQDRNYGVRVAVISDPELLKSANFVLAVNAQLPPETLQKRFSAQVKIGPVDKFKELVNRQLPGIPFRLLPVAPRQIPYHAGFSYFELERGGDLWKQLEHAGGMAMQVAGEFPGLEMEFWAIRG